MALTQTQPVTVAEYDRLTEGNEWAELIRGEIVDMPLPSEAHAALIASLMFKIQLWMQANSLGGKVLSHFHFNLSGSVYGPDLAWTPDPDMPTTRAWPLMVEVLSPSNRPKRMTEKLEDYLATGATEVWTLNIETHQWLAYRAPTEPVEISDTYTPGDWMPGLTLVKAELLDKTVS